jgi:transcription elongation factor GreA
MQGAPLSKRGKEILEKELYLLKNEKRPQILKEIEEHRSLGDLSENAPYHAAREELGLTEARIDELTSILDRGYVVDQNRLPRDRVVFGTRVVVMNLNTEQKETYHLIGEGEADPDKGWILTTSPLGQAFIGKRKGEEFTVEIPAGEVDYRIESFSFIE